MSTLLKVAVQKKGRLSEKSLALLRDCGVSVSNGSQKLKAVARNFPLEVLYLRDDDIPKYVAQGVADFGIVGQNVLVEKGAQVEMLRPLGFGRCRLSIAVPREADYTGATWLSGRRIATSYPRLLTQWLTEQGVTAQVETISGSVEIAPGIGLADAVCDLVSTGSTLLMNGLKEVARIFDSEAVLIGNDSLDPERRSFAEQLLFRMDAVQRASDYKYILLNAPNEQIETITTLLPGMKSPSVLPLSMPGWSSLHSVVREQDFWQTIADLKAAGAEGILVCPIEKMIA